LSLYLDKIVNAVIKGKLNEIEELIRLGIEDGMGTHAIIIEAMIAAMDIVGEKFSNNEIYIPEMLASAVTMKKGLDLIKPLLKGGEIESKGTIIICTVKGDIHDIGKNLVIMMLEGAGFNVIDLGIDVAVDKLIQQVEKIRPDVVGLSALLTATMAEMKNVIEALEAKGLRDSLRIMVGGAPVTAAFAEKIGADGYGKDAAEAVEIAKRLTSLS
jgi:5-methyltetrahydrofolate--homocysteine methyltransferase